MKASLCKECWYYTFDEESGEYYCDVLLDEDEYAKMLEKSASDTACRYFHPDVGEYGIVKKQN